MTSEEINTAWAHYDEVKRLGRPCSPVGFIESREVSRETKAFEMAEDAYNAADHLFNSGDTGEAHFPNNNTMTRISGKGATSRMLLYHRIASINSKEFVLFAEKEAYRNLLVQSNTYSPGVIGACVHTFFRMCKKLAGRRVSRKFVGIGSTYYTLKLTSCPTISEMVQLFNVGRPTVLKSIKTFRRLCFEDDEMTWIFIHEKGESNLIRFVNMLELPWQAVVDVGQDLAARNADPHNNHHVLRSIRRYMAAHKIYPVPPDVLYKYICAKCAN